MAARRAREEMSPRRKKVVVAVLSGLIALSAGVIWFGVPERVFHVVLGAVVAASLVGCTILALLETRARLRAGERLRDVLAESQVPATLLAFWLVSWLAWRVLAPGLVPLWWLGAAGIVPAIAADSVRNLPREKHQRWWGPVLTAADGAIVMAGALLALVYWWPAAWPSLRPALAIAALSFLGTAWVLTIIVGFAAWWLTPYDADRQAEQAEGEAEDAVDERVGG